MAELTIGCDTGLEGAIVGLLDGVPQPDLVVRARKYAVVTSSASMNRLDCCALARGIYDIFEDDLNDVSIYIEDPNMMFRNGATRLKTQFETIGMFKYALEVAGGKRIITVQPSAWKKKYGLISKGKRASVDRVHEIFPGFGKLLVKDADIAEAILIGRFGWKYLNI